MRCGATVEEGHGMLHERTEDLEAVTDAARTSGKVDYEGATPGADTPLERTENGVDSMPRRRISSEMPGASR